METNNPHFFVFTVPTVFQNPAVKMQIDHEIHNVYKNSVFYVFYIFQLWEN